MEGTLEELRRISNCPEGATFSQLGLRKSVGAYASEACIASRWRKLSGTGGYCQARDRAGGRASRLVADGETGAHMHNSGSMLVLRNSVETDADQRISNNQLQELS